MQSVLLTMISRDGVLWQIRLCHVSRDISPTGLALIFVPASDLAEEEPILRPVSVTLMEELFSGVKGSASARLGSELDAALQSPTVQQGEPADIPSGRFRLASHS